MNYYLTDPLDVLYLAKHFDVKFIWNDKLLTYFEKDHFNLHFKGRDVTLKSPGGADFIISTGNSIRSLNSFMHEDHKFYIHDSDVSKVLNDITEDMPVIYKRLRSEIGK